MADIITMSKKEVNRIPVLTKLIERRIDNKTAAKIIGISIRQIKRIKKRFKKDRAAGLIHKGRNQPGHNRLPEEIAEKATKILTEHYADFKPTMASEKLAENHEIKLSKETVRQIMIKAKLWVPKQERLKAHYRTWRERKEQYGEMEQYDGSSHDWFEGRLPKCTLLVAIDDATGKLSHLRFAEDEGVVNTFLFWQRYLEKNGKPLSIYLDRYSTYKINTGDHKDDPNELTQFQRAMEKDLAVKIIHARSPEAKGRVERVIQTLQDRLPKELRLAKINTVEQANRFLENKFIDNFNGKFAVVAQKQGDLHRPVTKDELKNLTGIMSVQTPRKVNNDFTVSLNGVWYQLGPKQPTMVLKKDVVIFEERLDKSVHIRKGRHYLNYMVLPERPKKVINLKVAGLTKNSQHIPKPPADHPWRKLILHKPVEVLVEPKQVLTIQV